MTILIWGIYISSHRYLNSETFSGDFKADSWEREGEPADQHVLSGVMTVPEAQGVENSNPAMDREGIKEMGEFVEHITHVPEVGEGVTPREALRGERNQPGCTKSLAQRSEMLVTPGEILAH